MQMRAVVQLVLMWLRGEAGLNSDVISPHTHTHTHDEKIDIIERS